MEIWPETEGPEDRWENLQQINEDLVKIFDDYDEVAMGAVSNGCEHIEIYNFFLPDDSIIVASVAHDEMGQLTLHWRSSFWGEKRLLDPKKYKPLYMWAKHELMQLNEQPSYYWTCRFEGE